VWVTLEQRWLGQWVIAACLWVATSTSARTDDMKFALAAAYQNDPRLIAERARLRAADEQLAIAQSGYRPRISADADLKRNYTSSDPSLPGDGDTLSRSASISASQVVFDGFQTRSAVAGARFQIEAARADFARIEQETLLEAIRAYVGVHHGRSLLVLRRNEIDLLNDIVDGTEKHIAAGELVNVDLQRAKARASRAKAEFAAASVDLDGSSADYVRIVGVDPGELKPPTPAVKLPRSLIAAIQQNVELDPALRAAQAREQAAVQAVQQAAGRLMPTATLEARYGHSWAATTALDDQETSSVSGRLTIPLYAGGETEAQIRQAKHQRTAALSDVTRARLDATATLKKAWTQFAGLIVQERAAQAQVQASAAARLAIERGREAGQNTVIEQLDAAKDWIDAQIALANVQRDRLIAGYALAAAAGTLTAEHLNLPTRLDDPTINTARVDGKAMGLE
jgi:outer membrane protein